MSHIRFKTSCCHGKFKNIAVLNLISCYVSIWILRNIDVLGDYLLKDTDRVSL